MQRNTGYFPTESLEPSGNRLFSRSALNEGYLFRGSLRQHRTIHKRHFSEQQQPRKARITLLIDSREHTASSRQAGPVSQKQIC